MRRGTPHALLLAIAALLVAGAAVLVVFVAVPAMSGDDHCDKHDAIERDEECGYYAQQGGAWVWVWYPWVDPVTGGKPPKRSRPTPPAGGHTAVPVRQVQQGGVQQPVREPQRHNGALRPDQQTRPVQPAQPPKPAKISGR